MKRFHLNHIKLRDKWMLMYLFCVLGPIVLTNVIFYNVTTNNIRNQKIHDADIAIEQHQRELRAIIDEAAGISYLYYIDPILNKHLNHTYQSDIEYVEAFANVKGVFYRSDQATRTIASTIIYTNNPTILSSGMIMPLTESIMQSSWYSHFMESNVSYPLLIRNGNSFSLVQKLNSSSIQDNSYVNLIKIDLNMNTVSQLFASAGFEGKLYFVDPNGVINYSNDNSMEWKSKRIPVDTVPLPTKAITYNKTYYNNNYLNGWSLQGVMDEKLVLQEVRKSRSFVLYLAVINLALSTVIIVLISRSIHVRLVRILRHMKKVRDQKFNKINDSDSRDEIGQLMKEFNRMTDRISSLINDVYVAEIQNKDLEIKQQQAQLDALHSQINPHFLFNALETIRMRSLIKGEQETAKMIHHMSKIFRKSITWSRNWVTVREELELIQCFLEIQKYRFGDKLEYQITVDEAVYEQYIPKMTFVPFVENASIHGIESIPGIGLITVQIGYAEDWLVFKITDNGSGMSSERLNEILQYLKQDDSMGKHIGIKNSYYRLKLCYNNEFEFLIQSDEGKGTAVEIHLPTRAVLDS